ncbi:Nif3-like dinuclear metal center hexameric protein [Helicobacter jaachi]|uniref:GTP cyclohydrolase 1 type 2 homolog n=1 Tax=Helicobacter jaachi TaxID=1677920 RepID=A0A4U8TBU2_9HELI|nr:Nif3-like dinuclear metal center hexameric protein [Helicobacter jaachi]TLD97410.1 Nif3-like dinuclear metal center hexameric protein [Helicobacter jaachi]
MAHLAGLSHLEQGIRVKDIYELCDSISPFHTQQSWDNSGLNIGSLDSVCEQIVVCLEVSMPLAHALKPNTLVISHHPLLFRPINTFDTQSYPCNIAAILVRKNCTLLSLHTHFDISHLNAYLTHNVLQWRDFVQDNFFMYGTLPPQPLHKLAQYVRTKLNSEHISYVVGDDVAHLGVDSIQNLKAHKVSEIYVVCGSGCSLLSHIKPSAEVCFITSDVKHHDAMIAKSMGISLIDMGHYESEKYFVEIFKSILQNAGYNAIIADCKNPFCVC